jgi:hypothetical protein
MRPRTLPTITTALLIAMTIAPYAIANGTTHMSPQRVTQGDGTHLGTSTKLATSPSAPSTSSATNASAEAAMRAAVGKAKNRPTVTTATVFVSTTTGFQWDDAGIGAAAATGAIFLIVGLLLFTHTARRQNPASKALRNA